VSIRPRTTGKEKWGDEKTVKNVTSLQKTRVERERKGFGYAKKIFGDGTEGK